MAEKKLSEELRHCLDGDGCKDCSNYQSESRLTCPGLLQKAYEVVKRYEEMFPCWIGDTLYFIKSHFSYLAEPIKEDVRKVEIYPNEIIFRTQNRGFGIDKIGKTVFLTKESAEKSLKEMEDRKNGEIDKA